MTCVQYDCQRWTDEIAQRACTAVLAHAHRSPAPQTGDIIVHSDGAVARLWITDYSGMPYSVPPDPDYGFILNIDGTVDYTGTGSKFGNRRIDLGNITSGGYRPAAAEFWIDRCDEERIGDVVSVATDVWVWFCTEEFDDESELDYAAIAERIYTEDAESLEITEEEAKIVAAGWANEDDFPNLYLWSEGKAGLDRPGLYFEAAELLENLSWQREEWPHEGMAGPSIAAVEALHEFLAPDTRSPVTARSDN